MSTDPRILMLGYLAEEITKLKSNHTLAYEKKDPEGVHDLRVCVKKIKAFLKITAEIDTSFDSRKNSEIFREISKNACELRDIRVQMEFLEKLEKKEGKKFPIFAAILKNAEIGSYTRFVRKTRTDLSDKLDKALRSVADALLSSEPSYAADKSVSRFARLLEKLTTLCGQDNIEDNSIHEMRKLAKETHYTFEIIDTAFGIYENPKEFTAKIKKLHQALGNWHDCEVGVSYLNAFEKATIEDISPEADTLRNIFAEKKKGITANLKEIFPDYAKTKVPAHIS